MFRLIDQKLLQWKNKSDRKPLIILGARQIGKTYSILEFGNKNYKNAAYFYFEGNLKLQNLFVNANDNIQNLIIQLSIYSGINIIPETTLIIFDEIQSCNAAISSLKRIYEVMPNLHIICAGSLLGLVTKREGFSFPVGKVDILKMHPMNFYEFVLAIDNNNTTLLNEIQKCYDNNKKFSNHDKAIDLYNLYLVIGGMPDVVETYIKTKNLLLVKAKQMNILESYSKDMVKYCTTSESIKIESCFNSIPAQLAKENHKFQYNIIKSGARAKEYENCIDWLVSSNIVLKSIKIKQPIMPIKMYEDLLSYKIYMLDVGLFCAKCDFVQQTILFNNDNNISKGTLTETYVAEELNSGNISLHYWESNGIAEVDFIYQDMNGEIIPIEAKTSINVKSKSLMQYINNYKPRYAIRISGKNFGFENNIKSIPLYAIWCLTKSLNDQF